MHFPLTGPVHFDGDLIIFSPLYSISGLIQIPTDYKKTGGINLFLI